jgi:hypothetical protein
MRRIGTFTVAAAMILAGVGAWAASTAYTHTPGNVAIGDRLDPSHMTMNVQDLPTEEFVDLTFVFN